MKTWKEIALQYHILLVKTKITLEDESKISNSIENIAININQAIRENISNIKKLNENELKARKK